MTDRREEDVENPKPSSSSTSEDNSIFSIWINAIEICAIVVMLIVGGILLYCVLTMGTIGVVTIFLLINTILHIICSMTGNFGSMKVISPISDSAATIILMLAIITLSVWLCIVQAVDDWKHHILFGVQLGKWLKVLIIVFSYYSFRTGTQIIVVRQKVDPWLQILVDATYCVLVFPAVVLIMKVVPSWEHHTIIGLLTWKWICALIMVIVAQNAISIGTKTFVFFSQFYWCEKPEDCKSRKCVYYYIHGLRRSITFVLVAFMHLLTWKLYFQNRFEKSAVADKITQLGTCTFVSELIFGVLWGIKTFILLSWKAHTVYARSNEEIMRKFTKWYLLSSLKLIKLRDDQEPEDESNSLQPDETEVTYIQRYKFINFALQYCQKKIPVNREKNKEAERERKEKKWNAILEKLEYAVQQYDKQDQDGILSMHVKEIIVWAFLPDVASLPEDLDISEDKSDVNHKRATSKEKPTQSIIELNLKNLNTKAKVVFNKQFEDIRNKKGPAGVSAEDYKTWMERARQNCLQLQHWITGSREVLNFLNRLMIGFIITLVIIIWLLLTEILNTKVIVAISSPVLAATFIFGDTLKTMFQGIVFAYMMHPFTIGDLCMIDQTLLEVKRIGIWRTTFSKVGTEEAILYPNSVMASQAIINYASDSHLVLQEFIELSFDYDTKWERLNALKGFIKRKTKEVLSDAPQNPEDAVEEGSQGSAAAGFNQENSPAGAVQKDDMKDIEPSGSELCAQFSEPMGNNHEIKEIDNQPIGGFKPSAQTDQVPADDQEVTDRLKTGDDVEVIVKQVQRTIKMTVRFKYDKSILDMTCTKAFTEKMKKKSNIFEAIARFTNPQSSTRNAKEAEGLKGIDHDKEMARSLSW